MWTNWDAVVVLFFIKGSQLKSNIVSYKVLEYPQTMSRSDVDQQIERAFRVRFLFKKINFQHWCLQNSRLSIYTSHKVKFIRGILSSIVC